MLLLSRLCRCAACTAEHRICAMSPSSRRRGWASCGQDTQEGLLPCHDLLWIGSCCLSACCVSMYDRIIAVSRLLSRLPDIVIPCGAAFRAAMPMSVSALLRTRVKSI